MTTSETLRSARSVVRDALLVVGVAAMAPAAFAQHSDALLVSIGGQVVVGTASDIDGPNEEFALGAGAFETILRSGFVPPTPADYETDEPGFFALHGVNDAADLAALGASPLPAGAVVTASVTSFAVGGSVDSLFYWNGVGPVDFQPIATAQPDVAFTFSPAAFGVTGPNGDLDAHPINKLNVAGADVPDDGVYLIAPRVSVAGLSASDSFYFVMLADALITGEDELELVEHALEEFEEGAPDALVDFGGGITKDFAFYEEAVEWVENNLVVPEPNSAALGLLAVAGAAASRIRRAKPPLA